jgi:hypothetical protein
MLVAAAIALPAVAFVSPSASGGTATPPPDSAPAARCEVSETQVLDPDGEGVAPASDGWIVSEGLFVNFGENSTIDWGRRVRDGIYAKILWRRDSSARGTLRVKATRLPERDTVVKGHYTNHLGPDSEVIPGSIIFPHPGCWRVTGKSGRATLRATIRVLRPNRSP